jgi:hypothetical protein
MRKMMPLTTAFAVVIAGVALAPPVAAQQKSYDYPNMSEPSPALDSDNSQMPSAIANPKDTDKTTAAPVPGKNSFTEGQARSRLEANGYTNVVNLAKDEQSIWHGQAMRGGKQVAVMLDYQGNITENPPGTSSQPSNSSGYGMSPSGSMDGR